MPEKLAGKSVKCPKCQQPFMCPALSPQPAPVPAATPAYTPPASNDPFDFVASAAAPAAVPVQGGRDFGYMEPAVRAPRTTGWNSLSRASLFLCGSAICYLLCFTILYVLTLDKKPPSRETGKVVIVIESLLFVGANALGTVGLLCCMGVPASSLAKGPAITGTVFFSVATLSSMIVCVHLIITAFSTSPPDGPPGKFMKYLPVVMMGSMAGAFILTLLFQTIVASHARAALTLGSIVGYGVFFTVCPWAVVALSMFVSDTAADRRSRMSSPGSDPLSSLLTNGTLFMIFVAVLCGWFILNTMSLGGAVSGARRRGQL
jgi:hypothetical protein